MSISAVIPRKWSISKKELDVFDKKEIEHILKQFNQSCSGSYYMLDYYHKKIIVDTLSSTILCGHPKEIADTEGFDFVKRTISPEDQGWANQVNKIAYKFFFNYDEKKRMDLRLSYDLGARTINGSRYVLHHKVTPFKLCKNGNLWLGLCHVTESSNREIKNKAYIIDMAGGKKYNFTNGYFVLTKDEVLTNTEKHILKLMAKDMTAAQICKSMCVSLPVFNRHKRKIFNKLGVDKSTSAIHKAHMEGLI